MEYNIIIRLLPRTIDTLYGIPSNYDLFDYEERIKNIGKLLPQQQEFLEQVEAPPELYIDIFNKNLYEISSHLSLYSMTNKGNINEERSTIARVEQYNAMSIPRIFMDINRSVVYYGSWDYIDLIELLDTEFAKHGYVFQYVGYVKKGDPHFDNNIVLSPQSFETRSISSIPLDVYKNLLEWIKQKTTHDNNTIREIVPGSKLLSHYGWDRARLQMAIKDSGLAVELGDGTMIPKSAMGVTGKEGQRKLPGFFDEPTLPRLYYEVVYRHIFHTLDYIDWNKACQLNIISDDVLRYIAKEEYEIDGIENMKYDELCRELDRLSIEHRAKRK